MQTLFVQDVTESFFPYLFSKSKNEEAEKMENSRFKKIEKTKEFLDSVQEENILIDQLPKVKEIISYKDLHDL